MKVLALGFLLIMFAGQTALQAMPAAIHRVDREVSLRKGQKTTLRAEKITIKFDSVVEDSRCPEGTNCIWAGNAKIRLMVSKAGKRAKAIELNTAGQMAGDASVEAQYENYKIKLISLGSKPGYSARLQITSTR